MHQKCRLGGPIKDNRFCLAMDHALNDSDAKSGLVPQTVYQISTMTPKWMFIQLHSGAYKKRGILLNFCPFCGAKFKHQLAKKKK